MSPLARSLLAVACAALLRAGCTLTVFPGLDNALSEPYEGVCATQMRGDKSRITITLETIEVEPNVVDYELEIPNACVDINLQLVGNVVTACDTDGTPTLELGWEIGSPGDVHRLGILDSPAHCFIKLYCL